MPKIYMLYILFALFIKCDSNPGVIESILNKNIPEIRKVMINKNKHEIQNNFKKGVLMNLLNPKVFLFFTLFFPNFIYSETISFKFQILSLGLIFIIVTFIVFGLIILFSNFIHKKFSSNNRFKIFAKYFNILVLLFIALLILFTENNLTLIN